MALPNTGITTTLVGQTLGTSSRDVGTLFLHPNVNEWGFNCPGINNMKAVWGKPSSERQKLSPNDPNYVAIPFIQPGYNLGYFRGYDHDWVVYLLDGINHTSGFYEDNIVFKILIEPMPKLISKPVPVPSIEHIFKIEFARNENQFNLGTATVISNNFIAKAPFSSFEIEPIYPPDYATNGSLSEGEKFYLKITHLSSPERRWVDVGGESVTIEYTTPSSAYTNSFEYRNFTIVAVKKTTAPAMTMFKVEADLYADFSGQQIIDFTGTMSTTSGYTSNVYNLYDNGVIISTNPTPGTASFVKRLSFDFSGTTLTNFVSAGNTVYGKIVASTGQAYTGSAVVTDNPPLD
jgi:hypothetical protein